VDFGVGVFPAAVTGFRCRYPESSTFLSRKPPQLFGEPGSVFGCLRRNFQEGRGLIRNSDKINILYDILMAVARLTANPLRSS